MKFSMSLFFYLFTFAINLWHRKFVTTDVTAVFVNNQHDIQRRGQDFDKKICIWRSTKQWGCQMNFLRKAGQSVVFNKLCRKLRDTDTVDRRPGSGRPRSARTEENAKLLLQKFPQSATDFVLPIVRWSNREHLFVCKENRVGGRLRELLEQKLSALHASSAVRVCQLLCSAPLETLQKQVLTNNPGHRRLMNTRLSWYLTDSPVGLRLVLLTRD